MVWDFAVEVAALSGDRGSCAGPLEPPNSVGAPSVGFVGLGGQGVEVALEPVTRMPGAMEALIDVGGR